MTKYGFGAAVPGTVDRVEKRLPLPYWHWSHDQGYEGSCVGHAVAMERAITNRAQAIGLRVPPPFARRYDPIWQWNHAKAIDEWPETNPGDDNGTSVRAAYEVARTEGVVRVSSVKLVDGKPTARKPKDPDLGEGVGGYWWAVSVDEIRTAISLGSPVVIGVDWYSNFDRPEQKGREWFIGAQQDLGYVRGGHAVCLYGASDRRQAFALKNSWGRDYPLVWVTYAAMQTLLAYDGEAALVVDR